MQDVCRSLDVMLTPVEYRELLGWNYSTKGPVKRGQREVVRKVLDAAPCTHLPP
jgi:hypothetical protein